MANGNQKEKNTAFLNEVLWLGLDRGARGEQTISTESALAAIAFAQNAGGFDWLAGCPMNTAPAEREDREFKNPCVLSWVFVRMMREARLVQDSSKKWIEVMGNHGIDEATRKAWIKQEEVFERSEYEEACGWLGRLEGDTSGWGDSAESKENRSEFVKSVSNAFGLMELKEAPMALLLWGLSKNDLKVVKWCVEHGADVNAKVESKFLRYHHSSSEKMKQLICNVQSVEMFDLLVECGFKDECEEGETDPLQTFRKGNYFQKDAVIERWTKMRAKKMGETGSEDVWKMVRSAKKPKEVSALLKDFDITRRDEKGRNVLTMVLEECPGIAHYVLSVLASKKNAPLIDEIHEGVSNRVRLLTSSNESKVLFDAAFQGLSKEEAEKMWEEVIQDRLERNTRRGATGDWHSYFINNKTSDRLELFFEKKQSVKIREMVDAGTANFMECLKKWMSAEQNNQRTSVVGYNPMPWAGWTKDTFQKCEDQGFLICLGIERIFQDEKAKDGLPSGSACFEKAYRLGGGALALSVIDFHCKNDASDVPRWKDLKRELERMMLSEGVATKENAKRKAAL
jgi:hypothetical protein